MQATKQSERQRERVTERQRDTHTHMDTRVSNRHVGCPNARIFLSFFRERIGTLDDFGNMSRSLCTPLLRTRQPVIRRDNLFRHGVSCDYFCQQRAVLLTLARGVFLFVFDYWLSGLVKSLWFISDLALLLCISTTR
jgi:hypothetical protein